MLRKKRRKKSGTDVETAPCRSILSRAMKEAKKDL